MWRAFFLSLGIYSFLLGVECLAIERAVVSVSREASTATPGQPAAANTREITPPEWAPWSLMSGGAVVMLYSFTIPKKMKS